uniref:hypothetical protein n=1 Tax=Alistipes sp. TaxID=1872444 RepID=UPI0040571CA3
MRQYTTPEQTAKLIELGVEKPKIVTEISWQEEEKDNPIINANTIEYTRVYSIGELLSFLPKSIKVNDLFFTLCIHSSNDYWIVEYADIAFGTQARLCEEELIDALFVEIVILKEEGVI